MSNIIEAFTEYGELYNEKYFAFVYNKVASVLNLQTPIISNKSNYDKVVKELFTEIDLELVLDFKKWDSESNSNSDFTNDFPKDILFKGKN